jgi:molecular chaperone GrpE
VHVRIRRFLDRGATDQRGQRHPPEQFHVVGRVRRVPSRSVDLLKMRIAGVPSVKVALWGSFVYLPAPCKLSVMKKQNDTQATETDDPVAQTAGHGSQAPPVRVASEELAPKLLTAEEMDDLKTRAGKADEYWDRLLRQTADFDNYKKRIARERQEAAKYANVTLIEKLIPVLDNIEMALTAAGKLPSGAVDSIRQGLELILQQLKGVLAAAGLEELDTLNKPFDPNWQEAVSQQETAAVPEGQVLQQLRKGYKLRDRLVRPAMVVLAKKPAA